MMDVAAIRIAGWQKQSLIDYPGKVACVIFLAGCNMRCRYCHNQELFEVTANQIPFMEVLDYLKRHAKLLDAVVISGGEPTLDLNLPIILRELRQFGLKIKLDTNGTQPEVVRDLVTAGLIDYVALDVKAPAEKHVAITGVPFDAVLPTVQYLKSQSSVPYMLRTTLTPQLTMADLIEMGEKVINGAQIWQIQQCRIAGAYLPEKVCEMASKLKKYALDVVVRGL